MLRSCSRMFGIALTLVTWLAEPSAKADDQPATSQIQREIWALPIPLPMIAYVVRPIGPGPFPPLIRNKGVSLTRRNPPFFPQVKFRNRVMRFARQVFGLAAPAGSGY